MTSSRQELIHILCEKWLKAYGQIGRVTPNFDVELYEMILASDTGIIFELIKALTQSNLRPEATSFLGASLCEDLLNSDPEFNVGFGALVLADASLLEAFSHAWGGSEMPTANREFLGKIHSRFGE